MVSLKDECIVFRIHENYEDVVSSCLNRWMPSKSLFFLMYPIQFGTHLDYPCKGADTWLFEH